MAVIYGCEVPEDLYFDIERSIWARLEPGGVVVSGFSDAFQTRAGKLLVVQPLPLKERARGKACATVESAKWVGGFATVVTGQVLEYNADLVADPNLANRDPYGAGWVVRIRAIRLEAELPELLTGPPAVQAYREKLRKDQIHCYRCAPEAENGPETASGGPH